MALDLDRRDVLVGAAAAAGLLLDSAAKAASSASRADEVSFLVVGDWGRNGESHQRDVAGQMEKAAAEFKTSFVVSVGDNFYEDGVQSVNDPLWKTSFEDIYTGAHLKTTPWYVALGNHDYGRAPEAQVAYTAHSARWKMPSRYYKVSGEDIGFSAADLFVIDTSPLIEDYAHGHGGRSANIKTQDGAAQLAWLDRELAASKATYKLVLGHHTIFSGGSGHGDTPDMITRVLPILKRHGVHAYINGHDHDLQHIERDGVHFLCSGAGSEVRPVVAVQGTRFHMARSGFAIVTLKPRAIAVAFRDYTGATIYDAVI